MVSPSKPTPGPHFAYGFLTTAPNAIVEPPAHRKRRSIGPLMALFVPGYFLRPSPTRRSRSAHRSSTLVSIRASNSSAETVGIRNEQKLYQYATMFHNIRWANAQTGFLAIVSSQFIEISATQPIATVLTPPLKICSTTARRMYLPISTSTSSPGSTPNRA